MIADSRTVDALPPAVRATLTADLLNDPQLTREKLKEFQDSMNSCYKFVMVCVLSSAFELLLRVVRMLVS